MTKSYALKEPESGEYWRFMTTTEAWRQPDQSLWWQSDTPVSLSLEEAEAFQYFQVEVVGNDPFEIVEVEGPPTHRFADHQPPIGTGFFYPQLERCKYRCSETLELFEADD